MAFKFDKEINKRLKGLPNITPNTINITVTNETAPIGIMKNAQASRYCTRMVATVSYNDKTFNADAVTSYDVETAQEFQIQSAHESAQDRLVIELSARIQQQLFFVLNHPNNEQ